MDLKNMGALVAGLVVSVILLTAVLVPIASTATEEKYTYENEGTPFASYDGETHTIVIAVDDESNVSITSDGETCENPVGYSGTATIVYAEDGYARISLVTGNARVFVSDSADSLTPTTSAPVTIAVESTGITLTNGTTTYTATCTPVAYIAAEGDYVLTTSPYVTAEDVIYLGGTTNYTSGTYVGFVGYGTIESLTATSTYSKPSTDTSVTISSVAAVVNTTEDVSNLVKIDSVVFTATLSDETTLTGTFSYFLAPAEIEYNNPGYIGNTNAQLLSIVPLLVTVGIIVGIVGMIYSRRE